MGQLFDVQLTSNIDWQIAKIGLLAKNNRLFTRTVLSRWQRNDLIVRFGRQKFG